MEWDCLVSLVHFIHKTKRQTNKTVANRKGQLTGNCSKSEIIQINKMIPEFKSKVCTTI